MESTGESSTIPTVDLRPFLINVDRDGGDEETGHQRIAALGKITRALETCGFFRLSNHGVPPELMALALELSKAFFSLPHDEKRLAYPKAGAGSPLPAGYARQPEKSTDKNEYFLMFPPELGYNVYPGNPPELRTVLDEVFDKLSKTALVVNEIISECMGLPVNFLRNYNHNRDSDFMIMLRYEPATAGGTGENTGLSEHEDGNCFTFIFQDEVGGLQVQKDGEWVEVMPEHGTIVVNVADVIQVLSNKRFKSATHRVVRKSGEHRHSFAFFFNIDGEKWIEPLQEFTTDVGEKPKYRGFLYKEYQMLRMRNKTHPPSRPEDVFHITHYECEAQSSD